MPGPVSHPVKGNAQGLLTTGGNGVIEPDAFDETAVATGARIGHDNIEEGALLGAATCKPDHDHD